MATTSGTLVEGRALTGWGSNRSRGRYGVVVKLAAGVAVLGFLATLAFGGPGAPGAVAPEPGCIYADGMGVPGEGCGARVASLLVATMAGGESDCVHADGSGVPGEGCRARATAPTLTLVSAMAADEPGCVYADALGVPGEGCRPGLGSEPTR